MNICDERHDPACQITYRGARGSHYHPIWLVCEDCLKNQEHFGSEDQIKTIGDVLT